MSRTGDNTSSRVQVGSLGANRTTAVNDLLVPVNTEVWTSNGNMPDNGSFFVKFKFEQGNTSYYPVLEALDKLNNPGKPNANAKDATTTNTCGSSQHNTSKKGSTVGCFIYWLSFQWT